MTRRPDVEKPLIFVSADDAENSGVAVVSASLAAEIATRFGPRNERPLSIIVYDGDVVIGGLTGGTHWGWGYIRQFWVRKDWRSQGVGHRLLEQADILAQARDCVGLYVDTFDPGAAKFYERCGFLRFGQIEDFPLGHARIFLAKRLAPG